MLNMEEAKIDLIMTPSTGIGINELIINVTADTNLVFKEQRIKIESDELSSPIYTQFGQYNRGVYGGVGLLKGPTNRNLFIENIGNHRPSTIKVTLPQLEINGRTLQPEPVNFILYQRPAIVGLCQ
jgi:hypothetical protein